MANNDGNQDKTISPHTQKVLFAEDLVNYILQKNSLPGILLSTEQVERHVRIFDNNVRLVVAFTNKEYEDYTEKYFNFLMDNNLINCAHFTYYANSVRTAFFIQEPDFVGFLNYSVHLAQLAGKLCAHEIIEASRIAVRYIVEAMDFDLALFANKVPNMVAREHAEYKRQSTDNVELYRKYAELRSPQPTNPQNVSPSGDIGAPGSSRGEPINLNFQQCYSSDSSEDANRQRKKPRLMATPKYLKYK